MLDQTYADEVGAVSLHDGVVRLDFITYGPGGQEGGGKLQPIFRRRVLMTIPDLLRSYQKLGVVMQGLIERGEVVSQAPGAQGGAASPPQQAQQQAQPRAPQQPQPAGVQVGVKAGVQNKAGANKVRSPNFPGAKPTSK